MIAPDAAVDLQRGSRFDIAAALLLGVIAVLAALLAVVEVGTGQQGTRAQLQAARLTTDLSAGIQASNLVSGSLAAQSQAALSLSMAGAGRAFAGMESGDEAAQAIGAAQIEAADALGGALTSSAATAGGPGLDAYTSRLVLATTDELNAEVDEQNRQVDLAGDAITRNTRSVLGLSFLALAGVLTGLGVVLKESRAGWLTLAVAAGILTAAGTMAFLAAV